MAALQQLFVEPMMGHQNLWCLNSQATTQIKKKIGTFIGVQEAHLQKYKIIIEGDSQVVISALDKSQQILDWTIEGITRDKLLAPQL